ncbi:restriction endonuclease subunit S [Pontixanthobacter aestiaquae]|uniref:Restriction endonuclease subunit S n=1 Tax=Pontixanthobacter aestiaquae TaxID=1509367 RepID=A0A844Z8G3_9SPHN|nr:restriction endonuclease subunit S [Pontixanthobacter aestiaquae]MDN3645772.1 restriction endonuclease subunit S [Pontixanthobacter aestiaquae]MXO83233.1 restriction endonuclease subunit S [Pontixanthobacter aestiaquae]
MKTVPLGELIKLQSGFAFRSADYVKKGHFLVRISNVQQNQISLTSPKYVALDDKTRKFALNEGDILTSLTGNVGRVAKVDEANLPAALNQRVARITVASDKLDPCFLYQFCSSAAFRDALSRQGHGAAQKNVSPKQIEEIRIPVPSLAKQKQIVAFLDKALAGIGTVVANAEKNLANAQELFDVELRRAFDSLADSCNQLTLAEAAIDFGRGKSKHRPRNDPKLYGGRYPFVQTGDVRNSNHILRSYSQSYNDNGLAQSKLWPKGTLCVTIAANIAETAVLDFEACFPDSIIGIVVDDRLTTEFYVEYLLQSLKSTLQSKGKGSAQANINLATFANERFPFPSLEKQREITDHLDKMSKNISLLKANYSMKIDELNVMRECILHSAFSAHLINAQGK